MEDKEFNVLEEISEDLNLSHQSLEGLDIDSLSSLTNLKPLCFNTLSEGLGLNMTVNEPVLDSSYASVQNGALRNLGFVSPPKVSPIMRKGYFLRSVSKAIIDGFGSNRDPFEILPDKGWVGVLVKDNHNVNDGTRALRDFYASSRSPLLSL